MWDCKPMSTPMRATEALDEDDDGVAVDQREF